MLQVFASPSRYAQGPGATESLGSEMRGLGLEGPVLIVAGGSTRRRLEASWTRSCAAAGYQHDVFTFGGQCCRREIDVALASARSARARTVVGAGGGKAIDTARSAAATLGLDFVSCPTIASTDAPTSAVSIIYSEDGTVVEIQTHPRNPALVLVDTSVILAAPARFLVAGMGDALSTWFEARACSRSGAANCRGGTMTRSGLALAELCWNTLRTDGAAALAAQKAGTLTPAFERIVEANTLLSGLGFESVGLAAAHAVHNGLSVAEGCHAALHGEKVAFGTLTELVLEQAGDEEINAVLDFCVSVGLPVTLAQIGLEDIDSALLRRIAERAIQPDESTHNEPFPVTAEMVEHAILTADAAGRRHRSRSR
jgi:glycerol dehydrogenase